MGESATYLRAIRVNTIGGSLFLVSTAVGVLLVVAGVLPMEARLAVWLGFSALMTVVMFWTARSLRRDLADPAGIERRFSSQAMALSAAILAVGVVGVVGVIAWGLLR